MASGAEAGLSASGSTARGLAVGDPGFSGGHANPTPEAVLDEIEATGTGAEPR